MKIFTPTVVYRVYSNWEDKGPHFATFVLARAWVEQHISPFASEGAQGWWIDEEEVHESLP